MIKETILRLACLALAGVLAQATPAHARQTPAEALRDPSTLMVIAHRGCVGDAPEVSLASIHACDGAGIQGIELDVRRSRDGHLVAIHDATVDRTTNGSGKVAEMDLADIRRLRLRVGYGGPNVPVTDEPVPTVDEMLRLAKDKGYVVHLDIKAASYREVADAVAAAGMAGQATAWISGRPDDPDQVDPALGEVLALVPRIQACGEGSPANCRPNSPADLMGFARFRPAGYFLWYRATPADFRAFQATPRPPGTRLTTETLWTVDNLPRPERQARYRELRELGADMFLTDRPAELAAFLRALERRGDGPAVAAHRGGAMHRPENTLPAFRHAAELGADVLELDMVMTADDQLVVYHDAAISDAICIPDPTLEVTLPVPVRSLTLPQVRRFDCGSRVRGIYDVPGYQPVPGERIPTVDEVLREFAATGLVFYAETKVPKPSAGVADVDPEAFARRIDELVRRHGVEDRFILQSSDYRTIDALHAINPRIRTCLLGAHRWKHRDFLATLRRHGASCILLRDNIASREDVKALQDAGILVYSEVIDDPGKWEAYRDLGVDVIFTNHPEGALDFLGRSKPATR